MHHTLLPSIFGFVSSLILTMSVFFIVIRPDFFSLGLRGAMMTIFILAVIQATLQSIFFLNIMGEKGPRWNLIFFGSTISIICIIVFFSIWIMNHLNYNMMGLGMGSSG